MTWYCIAFIPPICMVCSVFTYLFVLFGWYLVYGNWFYLYYGKIGIVPIRTGAILIPIVIAYLLRPRNTRGIPLATVIRGASVVLVPSVTCGRGITPLRGHPCSHCWVLNVGCLCVDTTLDRIRPLSQPQTTTSAMHM